ncbi:FAD-dependent oxidoreductase [Rubellicoccus peritrichatus]|uniref:FAD-dependent oxidoreductase n=1 Tax=Rubellicoccus peritrichatus TaxID=3080537 RepID=A0AAQ3QRY5_9BACT|nr:FAD-dependent oxidoreductase [Puniceicoccus sp. CR14]WOO39766.1 FAD-dependent oxidoreductase [Puniceicoccus sp. CR14]
MDRPTRRIDWYRTKVKPELMRELSESSDLKGLFQAGGHLGLVAMSGGLAVFVSLNYAWFWLIPVLFVHGTFCSNMNAGVHELIHERVFKTPWMNRAALSIISFMTWWNHRFFLLSHNEHHKYTLHQPDDLEVTLPQHLTFPQIVESFIIDYKTPFRKFRDHARLAMGRTKGSWEEHVIRREDKKTQQWVFNWSRIMLAGHGAVLFYSIYSGLWILPIVVSLGRFYAGGLALLVGATQHIGLVDKVNDFRVCCRTIQLNRFFAFLYWNMNYHIEHHMYPVVPCYNLPRLHEAIKHELPRTPKGLFETWVQIAYILNRQKYEPDYQYRAPLPTDPVESSVDQAPVVEEMEKEVVIAKVWECALCGFIYDEEAGLPEEGIEPGTRWDDIADDWICPVCGVSKAQFKMIEISREVAAKKQANPIDAYGDPIIIVGSGIAGYNLAREIRKHDDSVRLMMITRDGGESYYKPMLSNALTTGKHVDDLVLAEHAKMANQLKLEIFTHTNVTEIDSENKTIKTSGGDYKYHKLVLALGADQISLPIQGNEAHQILTVNDLDDFRKFTQALPKAGKVAVIGAGLIGCEFANDLASSGYSVDVMDIADRPLAQLLPEGLSKNLEFILAQIGVSWQMGCSVSSINKGTERPYVCQLSDGRELEADLVLSAVGLRPRIELAKQAGLHTNKGIVVDESLATSDPSIYALGDCIEMNGELLPYVMPIMHETKALARTLTGDAAKVEYPVMPVTVKTASCHVTIIPPKRGAEGEWRYPQGEDGYIAEFYEAGEKLTGVALIGDASSKAESYVARLSENTSQPEPLVSV